jgi:hypothetical protein
MTLFIASIASSFFSHSIFAATSSSLFALIGPISNLEYVQIEHERS